MPFVFEVLNDLGGDFSGDFRPDVGFCELGVYQFPRHPRRSDTSDLLPLSPILANLVTPSP